MFEELVDVRESNTEAGKDRKRKALGADEEERGKSNKTRSSGVSITCRYMVCISNPQAPVT